LDNDKTKERLQTEMEKAHPNLVTDRIMLQISRYPLESTKKWIVRKEVSQKRIYLSNELKVIPI
jgi:hypothetical protein